MAKHLLTDRKCKAARPGGKPLNDGDGLKLYPHPNGSKYWRLRYVLNGRDMSASLGIYPDITLEEARRKAAAARRLVEAGRNVSMQRKLDRAHTIVRQAGTFDAIADEWLEHGRTHGTGRTKGRPWSAHHHERNEGLLRRILRPDLGAFPADEITESMLIDVIRKTYKGGTKVSALRALDVAAHVFGFGKAMHRCARNPAREIDKGMLFPKPQVQHFAALALDQVGPWLKRLNASTLALTTRTALYLMFVTGLRDAALRAAKWGEFDLDAGLWLVPEARRKTRVTHPGEQRLPLPRQAVALLRELAELTDSGPDSFVFASYGKHGYLAENTLAKAMRDLGFDVTVHGFRSLLTDLLTPLGFMPFAIDRQLDHAIGHTGERTGAGSADPKVLAAYLRADFLDYRRAMMQWVADWADAMAAGKKAPALPMGMVQPAAVIELRPAA